MPRRRFVAEIASRHGALVAIDPWREQDPPVPLGADLEPGTYAEVEVDAAIARPSGFVAAPGSALASLVRIAIEQRADPVFSEEVEREVEAILAAPGLDDPALVDLSQVPFITIDNPGSKDLDQALHIEREGAGYCVRYALADAAYYVRTGSALFAEALARGASFYFPGWKVPMLPVALSEGIVSLLPNVPRRALVFEMHLDRAGVCAETRVLRARIESRAQLTYEGVQVFFDAGESHAYAREVYAESLRLLREVGELRIADAAARDVVHHRRVSVEVGLDDKRALVIYAALRNDVDRANEQISVLCNVEGARVLERASGAAHVQPIYRVHAPPDEASVRALADAIDELVTAHELDRERWCWHRTRGQSLAAYLRQLPSEPARIARAIERQAILMNARSEFTPEPGPHHGVGAPLYARFSAPMREVVGVFVHKELWEHLGGPPSQAPEVDDTILRGRVIEAANRAKDVQRAIDGKVQRIALDAVFARDAKTKKTRRPARSGTILGLTPAKVYVALDDPPLEVKLYTSDLERAWGVRLALGAGGVSLEREDGTVVLRAGDRIDLVVTTRDRRRDRWVLLPVQTA
jgi:ribonuclease R